MKKTIIILTLILNACVTTKGTYAVSAVDEKGNNINSNISMVASGSGIYTIRNAICAKNPNATVIIKDINTGKELTSESPYKCH